MRRFLIGGEPLLLRHLRRNVGIRPGSSFLLSDLPDEHRAAAERLVDEGCLLIGGRKPDHVRVTQDAYDALDRWEMDEGWREVS